MKAKTTYLVWKDPTCNGVNPQWVQLTRLEFHALVKSSKGNGRYFERLESTENDGSDGKFVMECTKTRYKAYLVEKRHKQYLKDTDPGYQVVSYHSFENDDDCFGEDFLRDEDTDVEAECCRLLEHKEVRTAVAKLSAEERHLICYFYLYGTEKPTERDYSALTGIPQKTVNDRKKRIHEKLKKVLK